MYCIGMRKASSHLEQFLDDLAGGASAGDRLPPIRDLMRRFGASQTVVQRAFESLKGRGLIASQVGRGTYFLADGKAAGARAGLAAAAHSPSIRSVLLLRRSISIARGRLMMDELQRRFTADGHRVLQISYTDPEHARSVLKGLPHFDACVIQSTFETITIDLLAALREKSTVLAVDGAALVGSDVEAVGMEWGEPLAAAIDLLSRRGHGRIAFASTAHAFLAGQLGQRRFDYLQRSRADLELHSLSVPRLPGDQYEATLVDMIKAQRSASGRPPFTALVAWGIENGADFRQMLSTAGLTVPTSLSVVLLGRTDLANEHAGFFDTIGCSVADQVEHLHRSIIAHWADPSAAYGLSLIPVTRRDGESIGAPANDDGAQGRASTARSRPKAAVST